MTQTDMFFEAAREKAIDQMLQTDIFHFYAPEGEQHDKCMMLKGRFFELANLIDEHVTRAGDRDRAISRLRQAFYWASCSILDIEETQG